LLHPCFAAGEQEKQSDIFDETSSQILFDWQALNTVAFKIKLWLINGIECGLTIRDFAFQQFAKTLHTYNIADFKHDKFRTI
jgi:hypothetical protein